MDGRNLGFDWSDDDPRDQLGLYALIAAASLAIGAGIGIVLAVAL